MRNIRVHLTIVNIKRFVCENKKAIISCAAVFLVGIILGICITIAGCQGEFNKVNTNDVVYGAFRVFLLFSLAELIGYFVLLLSIINFLFTLFSMCVLIYLGYVLGKYSCMLVACYSVNGVINLIFIYIPVFLICFVLMTITLIKILELSACEECSCKSLFDKTKTSCNCYGSQYNNRGYNRQPYSRNQGYEQYRHRNQGYEQYRYRNQSYREAQYQNPTYTKSGAFGSRRAPTKNRAIFLNLKPSVIFTLSVYGINVGLNFVIFIILGLIFPVIVV